MIASVSGLLLLGLALGDAGSSRTRPILFGIPSVVAIASSLVAVKEFRRTKARVVRQDREIEISRHQLDRQRKVVDSLADELEVALFICSRDSRIEYANPKAAEFFRFPEPVGRSVLAVTFSADLERLVTEAYIHGKAAHEVSFNYPEERVALAKAWTTSDPPGRVIISLFDITSLRHLMRVRQDFVANVSHELRTPLTVIRAMSETLLDEDPPNQELSKRYLNRIISEVDRLSELTEDLLTLSTIESRTVVKEAIDLSALVKQLVAELAPQALKKGLSLIFAGPDSLIVDANAQQLQQVMINIIQNGIAYTNQGSVSVNLTAEDGFAEIEVRDTGIGISTEHQARIFERFYRVDKARSRKGGGTGLGLSIVRHIVEGHGGTVTLRSAPNQGSVFTVRIPIR